MSQFFPPFLAVLLVGLEVALAPDTSIANVSLPQDLQAKYGADERTRTAYPCSLRVCGHALQGCARDCKCRISKGISLLCLAACCTVLRSRWYQSGIRSRLWSPLLSTRGLLSGRR
jgi:hypothetical protein